MAATVGASTRMEPNFSAFLPRIYDPFTASCESYLNDTYTSYVFAPVIGIALGYRVF
ncbi:MAG: hypothetical protein JXR96_20175 [Deltaproteobacteria bacterium]|nr:hypothetical protein [Deltaproteobacteria bacterium]